MADRLIRNWWALGVRGAAAMAFGGVTLAGLYATSWPALTLGAFVGQFIAYAFVDGALTLLTAARYRTRARDVAGPRDLVLVAGVAGTTLAFVALVWPEATTEALLALVAVWALVTGLPELLLAFRYRRRIPAPALLAGAGAAQVTLGVVLLAALAAGAVRVGWEIGVATLLAGALRLALAVRARGVRSGPRTRSRSPAETARAQRAGEETASGVAA